jgi:hypothetical protein
MSEHDELLARLDRIVTGSTASLLAGRAARGEIDRTEVDHIAAAVILTGKSEGARSKENVTIEDVEKANELLYESDYEMNSIEGNEI